jgi:coenzyme PQQ synthesis protein D (PqqD)
VVSPRFRINTPPVVAETLDGETTIVDLKSGTYHALNESGSFIWEELSRGVEPTAIAMGLTATYEVDLDGARRAVDGLVTQLCEQELIAPLSDGAPVPPLPAASNGSPARSNGHPRAYSEPELSTYTDMQELLLLDPVHEVDESGWPSQPQA